MHARGITSGVKQNEAPKVETHHELKAACQLMEQSAQIPVPDNCFRDRQQGFVLLADGESSRPSCSRSSITSSHSQAQRIARSRIPN